MTEKKEERGPQRSPKEWTAIERQSKALEELDTVLKSGKPAGEDLKKIVQDHTEACDEIKEKLEEHKADKVQESLGEQGFPEGLLPARASKASTSEAFVSPADSDELVAESLSVITTN